MPCDSSHMCPTSQEAYRQQTAKLYAYVLTKVTGDPAAASVVKDAEDIYCRNDYTDGMCMVLGACTPAELDVLVYSRSRTARQLADWWEDHQDADRRREAAQAKREQQQAIQAAALAKLTQEERESLGLGKF